MTFTSHLKIFTKRLLFILSAVVLFGNSTTFAITQSDRDAIYRDSVHYTNVRNSPVCSSVSFVGNNNAQKVYNFLIEKGLEPHQAAGVVGNLIAESSVIPNRKQGVGMQLINSSEPIKADIKDTRSDTGFGIAQWTTAGRQQSWLDYAKSKNMDAISLELEAQFLFHELETNAGLGLAQLKQAGELRQATWIFLAFFERPATVVNAGLAANPNQPTSGLAKATLDERVKLASGVSSSSEDAAASSDDDSSAGSSCAGGAVTGDESLPSFKANRAVKVDEPPSGPFSESDCTGGFTPGGESLRELVLDKYSPPVTSVGGYSCRQNTAGEGISVHGVGRALDIMIDGTTPKGLETGDRIRNFLINNSTALGVQRVIWNGHIWSADKDGWRVYDGPNPHIDHLHVEINLKAAQNANLGG
jgi:hypothetical protein